MKHITNKLGYILPSQQSQDIIKKETLLILNISIDESPSPPKFSKTTYILMIREYKYLPSTISSFKYNQITEPITILFVNTNRYYRALLLAYRYSIIHKS
jgi:hypothetical protein